MRIIHEGGFSPEERLSYREIVFTNMIESMRSIINAMHVFSIELSDERHRIAFNLINHLSEPIGNDLSNDIAQAIKTLWQDHGVHACYQRKNEFQLNDSAA
jgi:guanine nucleotide-binding protein G(i) subunit alpha